MAKQMPYLRRIRPQCTASRRVSSARWGLPVKFERGFREALRKSFSGLSHSRSAQFSNNPSVIPRVRSSARGNEHQSARWEGSLAAKDGRSLSPPVLFSLGTLFAKRRDYPQAIKLFSANPSRNWPTTLYISTLGWLTPGCANLKTRENAISMPLICIRATSTHTFRVGLDYAASGDLRKALPCCSRSRFRPDTAGYRVRFF